MFKQQVFPSSFFAASVVLLALTACNQQEPVSPEKPEPTLPVSKKNIVYSSFNSSADARLHKSSSGNSIGSGLFYGKAGDVIRATAAGDLDGDGKDEFFTALSTSAGSFIYRSLDSASIGNPIYSSTGSGFALKVLATGDFNKDGKDELIVALNATTSSGGYKVYKSLDGTSIGKESFSGSSGQVSALAAGDVNGDGQAELFTAVSAPKAAIFRSQDAASLGTGIYEDVNTSPYFTVAALALGDVDKDGKDELFSAFNSAGGPIIDRSDDGDAISSNGNGAIYNSTSGSITAMAVGDVDMDGTAELFTAISEPKATIYRSKDGSSLGSSIYQDTNASAYFTVAALAIGKY